MLTKELIPGATYPTSYEMPEARSRPGPRMVRKYLSTILHTTSLVASLLGMSLFAAAIPRWNSNFFHNTGPNRGDWTDGMPLGPLVFALLYHAATLIYNHARRQRIRRQFARQSADAVTMADGGKPSLVIIHVLSSSLILAALFASLILAAYGSLFRFWRPAMRTQSGGVPCTMINVFARECQPVLYSVGRLQLAGIVFGIVVWAPEHDQAPAVRETSSVLSTTIVLVLVILAVRQNNGSPRWTNTLHDRHESRQIALDESAAGAPESRQP
ncbi:hypothetical protein PV08_07462 [Exophiala spinifera]|uniref:Uncharacterized protein n=1 Tax=Exophiala spinifera TaxID=91928 RepID=A0A0D2B6Y0_9EURO|nr:uncharacterized protein PV08_07462 [Exophiala spinifera]KIW14678.1 hypothetical protein PV08_07462 [Exophiala spinifera]